tara:strand:- start:2255 stop:2836 length:582 start_codon:yes stop_codon:yes gene_type:complete
MLVNVRFFNFILKRFSYTIVFIFFTFELLANEKTQISSKINNLDSLEFTFTQSTNDKIEKGSCLLKFPGKLKCDYFDDKQKELIINNRRLAITQKKYKKTYHYSISKSPFINILYKEKLLEIVNLGTLKLSGKNLKLLYKANEEIIIFFDKKTLDLKGWEILDRYNNTVNFSLKIVSKNDLYEKGTFQIPKLY